MFNRFDVVEAYYAWLCLHHDGRGYPRQHPKYWSSYGRLSTMGIRLGYKPSTNLEPSNLTEEGKEIYNNLCRRAGWCDCLKEKKDA